MIILIFFGGGVYAEEIGLNIPDNSPLRREYAGMLTGETSLPKHAFKERKPIPGTDRWVEILYRLEGEKAILQFKARNEQGRFPLYAPGNWEITFDQRTGRPEQAEIFLFHGHKRTKIRLRRFTDEYGSLDLYIENWPVAPNVILPRDFQSLLMMPVANIVGYGKGVIDWRLLQLPGSVFTRNVSETAEEILERLGSLYGKEDGALDSSGRPVLIDSVLPQNGKPGLNCSGLVKWIVDGILRGRDQEPVSIQDAKKKITSARGNRWTRAHESAEDPFFGLDWTRNLALEAISPEADRASLDQVDVSSVRGIEYLENRGFPLQDLPYVLFQLVRNEPGYFYLGSINRRLDIAEGRELIKHHHTLAIFPFISDEESPSVEAWIFERIGDEIRALRYRDNQLIKRADSERNGSGSAVETEEAPTSADIYQRYTGEGGMAYVHLVRIRASGDFLPHELDLEGNEPL